MIKKVFEYLLIVCIILNFNTMFAGYIAIDLTNLIYIGFIILLIINIFIDGVKKSDLNRAFKKIIIYFIFCIPFMILNNDRYIYTFLMYYIVILPLLIVFFETKNKNKIYYQKYVNIVFFITFVSLIFYIFGSVLKVIRPNEIIHSDWSNTNVKNYNYLYFETQKIQINNFIVIRNSAIFTEPAEFAAVIVIAMMLKLQINDKSRIKTIVLVTALITTTSTAGIVLTIIFYLLKFLVEKEYRSIRLLIFPIILVIGISIINSLTTTKMEDMSGQTRWDDINACIETWKNNPLFGCGYNNVEAIKQNMSSFRSYNKGLSSSFFVLLAEGGIYLIALYIYGLTKNYIYKNQNRKYIGIISLTVYIIMFFMVVFHKTIISLIPVSYGITRNIRKNERKI